MQSNYIAVLTNLQLDLLNNLSPRSLIKYLLETQGYKFTEYEVSRQFNVSSMRASKADANFDASAKKKIYVKRPHMDVQVKTAVLRAEIDLLRRCFRSGNKQQTQSNILNWLSEHGIERAEYDRWGTEGEPKI